jgi:hypothetical protein
LPGFRRRLRAAPAAVLTARAVSTDRSRQDIASGVWQA